MMQAVKLWAELASAGIHLQEADDGNLGYGGYRSALTPERLRRMRLLRKDLLQICRAHPQNEDDLRDLVALYEGWLILRSGSAYSRQLSKNMTAFVFAEDDDKWTAWRGSWSKGNKRPYSDRTLVENVTFETAWARATGFVDWYLHRDQRQSA